MLKEQGEYLRAFRIEELYYKRLAIDLGCPRCGWEGLAARALVYSMVESYEGGHLMSNTVLIPLWELYRNIDGVRGNDIYCPHCEMNLRETNNA